MFRFVHSIRFRIWFLFIGFTSMILVFLYINQVILLPNFYDYIKTKETVATVNILKRHWGTDSFISTVVSLSREQYMRIQIDRINEITGKVETFTQGPSGAFSLVYKPKNLNDGIYDEVRNSSHGMITKKLKPSEDSTYLLLVAMIGTRDKAEAYITIHNYIEPLGNTSDILKSQFFMSASILLCVAFIVSAFVVVTISNPIIIISNSAKKLATGEFYMKTSPGAYAEIKSLVNNLNRASLEISKTENLRKDLIANISHDLKTPLTMIKAYSEMIRDLSGDNPEKRAKHLQIIIEEADRLNNLVMDLLDLSKIQSGIAEKKNSLYDFSVHLHGVMNRFAYLSETHDYRINTQIEDDVFISADFTKIEQVVYNLVINAINYTGEDKTVLVRLYKKSPEIGHFEVVDTGNGIPEEELALIWERYYRANKSEHYKRADMGSGLGLSIVKGVLDMHGFSYGVDSRQGEGSTFWFEFPAAPPLD